MIQCILPLNFLIPFILVLDSLYVQKIERSVPDCLEFADIFYPLLSMHEIIVNDEIADEDINL